MEMALKRSRMTRPSKPRPRTRILRESLQKAQKLLTNKPQQCRQKNQISFRNLLHQTLCSKSGNQSQLKVYDWTYIAYINLHDTQYYFTSTQMNQAVENRSMKG